VAEVVLATVTDVREVSPSFVRVTFEGVGGIECGGYDQRVKLLLAQPGQGEPVLPAADDWYTRYRAMPADVRPLMRTFTIRSAEHPTLDIEFALHGDDGPASAWAGAAKPGSVLGIVGASAGGAGAATEYEPAPDAGWQLLVGDETALPAIAAILEALPSDAVARAFVQVRDACDIRRLESPAADVEVSWTVGGGLAEQVLAARLPDGTPYAWIAGEAGVVRTLRRSLGPGFGGASGHYFGGYWRRGETSS
jgi:NADPH-dependent ferric siderophore reductase